MDNTELLATLEAEIDGMRSSLATFAAAQNEDSDESNEDLIQEAEQALDNLEAIVGGLVP
jgi:hypothetical protein